MGSKIQYLLKEMLRCDTLKRRQISYSPMKSSKVTLKKTRAHLL